MRNAFSRHNDITFAQIVPHVSDDWTLGLESLPAGIHLLETSFGDLHTLATGTGNGLEVKRKNSEFSQYNADFPVITPNLDWNPSALKNALRMGLSEEIKDSFWYTEIPDQPP